MSSNNVTRQALEGRLPLLPDERIYGSFFLVLWTWVTFAGSSWTFLVGVALPYTGNKEVAVAAYFAGSVIALVPIVLSAGLASTRYGVETIEVTKSSLGVRGIGVPLVGLLIAIIGTSDVLAAMTATAMGNILETTAHLANHPSARWIDVFGLSTLLVVWLITSRGPQLFEHIAKYVGPCIIAIAAVTLGLIIVKLGPRAALRAQAPNNAVLSTDKLKDFMIAFEWGAAVVLSFWPIVGGVTRLLAKQNDVVSPPIIALAACPLLPVAAAALGAVATGNQDPTAWLIAIGGPVLGTIALTVVVVANIIVMVIQYYLAGVISQHFRVLTRVRWEIIVALLILPGVYLAFWPAWVLSHFTIMLTYVGVVFAGTAGVTFVDYFVLRRQELQPAQLFVRNRHGSYYFWRGYNVVALAVVAFGWWFDLWMYNPVSMSSSGVFRYVGATIPTMMGCGILYFVLMKTICIPLGKGGYDRRVPDEIRRNEGEIEALPLTL